MNRLSMRQNHLPHQSHRRLLHHRWLDCSQRAYHLNSFRVVQSWYAAAFDKYQYAHRTYLISCQHHLQYFFQQHSNSQSADHRQGYVDCTSTLQQPNNNDRRSCWYQCTNKHHFEYHRHLLIARLQHNDH